MNWNNRKSVTALTLAVVLLIGGVGALLCSPGLAQTSGKEKPRVDQLGDPLPAPALARMGSTRFRHDNAFFVAYLPGGKELLSIGTDGIVRVWDAAKGTELRQFGKRVEEPKNPKNPGPGVGVMVWGMPTYPSAALSEDGKTLVLAGPNNKIQLWDVATGKAGVAIESMGPMFATFVALSPDGKHVYVKNNNPGVHMYDASN